MQDLERRLRLRNTESEESLSTRIARARDEILYADTFYYRLVNDQLERACDEADRIIERFLHS